MSEIYKRGNILKSTLRTINSPLHIMVCEDKAYGLTSTKHQFSAIVLIDSSDIKEKGRLSNNWNKGHWALVKNYHNNNKIGE